MTDTEKVVCEKKEDDKSKGTEDESKGKEGSEEVVIDATNLMAQGKRNLVCGEIPTAVSQLQEASRLLASKYGETADECGEAYFYYGKALLDLSRMESGVLGNALEGMSEDEGEKSADSADDSADEKMTEEEKEKISEQVIDAMMERDEEVKARVDTKKGENKDKVEGMEVEDSEKKTSEGDKAEVKDGEGDKKEVKESEESKDKTESKIEEKVKDTESESKGETEEEAESEDIADEEEATEGETEEGGTEEDEGTEGEEKEGKEGEAEKEKEEDDVSNLQLAWEMLELAKIIFTRHEAKEMKMKLAETHLKLGECGLETEQYEQAMGDFKQCLVVQKTILEPEDRALAETYYQLGLACTYNYKYDDAVENYRNAANIIEAKLAKLTTFIEESEKEGKGKDKADFDCPVYKARKELDDLKELLPDMIAKIEDVKEEKKNTEQVKQLVKDSVTKEMGDVLAVLGAATGESSESALKDDKPATKAMDISHLVRKKRKTEDEVDESTKKQKTDENASKSTQETKEKDTAKKSNGVHLENGKMNGAGDGTNGTATTNGKTSPEKIEIKTKTVEDVKQKSEQMDTEASS